jgi:plastocyanin
MTSHVIEINGTQADSIMTQESIEVATGDTVKWRSEAGSFNISFPGDRCPLAESEIESASADDAPRHESGTHTVKSGGSFDYVVAVGAGLQTAASFDPCEK